MKRIVSSVVIGSLRERLRKAMSRRSPGETRMVLLAILGADTPTRRQESQRAATQVLGLSEDRVFQFDFPDGSLNRCRCAIRGVLRRFAEIAAPDLIVTHRVDGHQDHATVCKLVEREFRHVSLFHFKVPQTACTGHPWDPAVVFRVSPEAAHLKLDSLLTVYETENWKDEYFNTVQHEGLMIEAGHTAGSGYAEPFEASRLVLETCSCGCGAIALARNTRRPASLRQTTVILVVVAHNDDEAIGPGATLATLNVPRCGTEIVSAVALNVTQSLWDASFAVAKTSQGLPACATREITQAGQKKAGVAT